MKGYILLQGDFNFGNAIQLMVFLLVAFIVIFLGLIFYDSDFHDNNRKK